MAENKQTLSSLIRGIQHCANTASQISARRYLDILENFYDKIFIGGKEVLKPKIVTIELNGVLKEVPLITLSNFSQLEASKLKVSMKCKIDQTEVKELLGCINIDRTSFNIKFGQGLLDNEALIEMEFLGKDPPEGISQLKE